MVPLPLFQLGPAGDDLEAAVDFPTWRTFGEAVDFPRQQHLPPAGALRVVIVRPNGNGSGRPVPSPEEEARTRWLLGHQEALREAFLMAVLEAYPDLQEEYGPDFEPEDRGHFLPNVKEVQDLAPLLRPTTLYLHPVTGEQDVVIGIEADCTWDQEHGLGVILRGLRSLHVGSAEHASQTWIAEQGIQDLH